MSTSKPLRVLMLEDNPTDAELVARELRRAGFDPQWRRVDTKDDYLAQLDDPIDIIFSDFRMPKFNTEEAFQLLQQRGLDIPFIILSGAIGEEVAAGLIKKGVTDYLLKDRLGRLGSAITSALKEKNLREENRRAHKALQENEARYRSLVEAMTQTVWVANSAGETISGSLGWRNYTGQNWEEARGWGWVNALHPEDQSRVVQTLKDALAKKKVYEAEYRVRGVDGVYGFFLARAVPVLMDDGDVREWVGTTTNITSQKQAEIRNAAFSSLGQQLSAAVNPHEAARIIVGMADKLLSWDCCTLDLYDAEQSIIYPLINIDVIDGKRADVTPALVGRAPTVRMQNVINNGPLLILRNPEELAADGSVPFGDVCRRSASIMVVPIRNGPRVVGILSIQSYSAKAYDDHSLETLQIMADYCGGALERIKTEQSLREGEERFRQMAENIREIFWLADPDAGELIYVSPAYETIWGRTLDELRQNSKSSLEAVVPEDRPMVYTYFQRYKTESCEVEYRIQRPDGAIRYVRDRAFPIRDATGKVSRVAGIAEDVTERRRGRLRDAAFSSLGERLNLATNAKEAAKIIVDVADVLFGWDCGYLSLYSAKDHAVRSLLNIDVIDGKRQAVPSMLTDQPTPRMWDAIKSGAQLILRNSMDQDLPNTTFGSGKLSASMMIVPIRAMTEVIGVLSIQSYTLKAYSRTDLESLQALADYCGGALKRIEAEEQLAYQAKLLKHVNDAIVSTDENFILTSWNHAAEEMYGWKGEDAIGRKLQEVIPMQLTGAQWEEIQQTLATTGNCCIEAKHSRRDGKLIDVEGTTIVLRNEGGRISDYVSVNRDVTKRHQLEDQLRQAQKMEAFGQLAGGVAHDFNNILTVIGGYTNLILTRRDLPAEVMEELSLVSGAAEKAANLTKQLLTFSRKKEMQLATTKLNEVVGNMTKMLHRVIGEQIKLQIVYAPGLPDIPADASMLEQVLLNLAINGRDAMMPRGGQLMVSTAQVNIGDTYPNPEAQHGACVCLSVRDTGCGMTSEIQARIFEPFFTTKGVGKGTGLGLATVYGIVKQHRGWIEVNSQVGQGTTFKVFLPVKSTSKTELLRPPVVDQDVRGGSETILLVEDEVGVRGLAKQILRRYGYKVIEAENGPKALVLWQQHQQEISLMVTDMVMPGGMNGRDLALQVEGQRPGFRVIYVSGYSVNLNDFELLEGWNFLQKPYQPKKLAKAIRDRLDAK